MITTKNNYRITADDRESSGAVLPLLKGIKGVDLSIQRLNIGDYVVNNKLLFERKTLPDFALSIKDGRLFRQASRLIANQKRAVIILEYSPHDLARHKMRREALQGALVTLTIVFGIAVLRSRNPLETVRLMLYAANQIQATDKQVCRRKIKYSRGKRRVQLCILQALPGIGTKRSQILLDTFGSVEAVINASVDELQNIPGLGHRTAEKIRWAVGKNE